MAKPKTDAQRRALHLGLKWLASHLNERGKTMRVVLKPEVEIPWTKDTVKKFLYKPILKAYADKDSTEDMNKQEPGEVWDIMMKFLGEHHGIEYMPWPSKHEIDEHHTAMKLHRENIKNLNK